MGFKDSPHTHLDITKLMKITLILFISVGSILVTFSVGGIQIISTTRASINEVGEWIELKDQIINQFNLYLYKKDKQHYYLLIKSLDCLKTIDSIIDNYLSDQLDVDTIKKQLSEYNLPETENDNIYFLMQYYSYFPGINSSISHWKKLSDYIQNIDLLIIQINNEIPLDQLTIKTRNSYLNQLYQIDSNINYEEDQLRYSLSQSAEWVKDILIWALIITSLFLLIGVSSIIIYFHYRIHWWQNASLENRKWYQSLFKYNPYPILSITTTGTINSVNSAMMNLLGFDENDLKNKSFVHYHPESEKRKVKMYLKKTLEGNPQHFESYQFDKGGNKVMLETTLVPIYINKVIQGVHAMKKDITQQKITQQELLSSLKEKEILLQEIHHRVKNNLAIIAGLLELQIENSNHPEVSKKLRDSQGRIYSMAAIHELIYKNENFLALPIDDYLKKRINDFRNTANSNAPNISINTSLDSICLNVNQAIPFALLFNEIFSNAWEHAFKNRKRGTIEVKLKERDEHIYLELSDNGIGLPQKISWGNMETMGMELIQTLVQQLDANINFTVADGTHINIIFKKSNASGSSSILY